VLQDDPSGAVASEKESLVNVSDVGFASESATALVVDVAPPKETASATPPPPPPQPPPQTGQLTVGTDYDAEGATTSIFNLVG
jgi:hypothetical protein